MRSTLHLLVALLLAISACHAGLVHRRERDLQPIPGDAAAAAAAPTPLKAAIAQAELGKDQIPVTVVEAEEGSLPAGLLVAGGESGAGGESARESALIAEDIAKATEEDQKLRATAAVAEAEKEAEENITQGLRKLPQIDDAAAAAESVPEPVQSALTETESIAAIAEPEESVRQATQATPTQQHTTPQNFVQQLIQPIGQFISQLTGQQQQQQQQQQQTVQLIASDQPAAPSPTIPGFLNPAVAFTSAQQAVQNAAQSAVNATTQAFQGLQQFASNLGNQFQSTLSNLGAPQNQLSTADSTTTRPPGPFQAIVSNFVGGGNNTQSSSSGQTGGQQPGPLQGIINFFQGGGNRPQGGAAASPAVAPSAAPVPLEPAKEEGGAIAVDDKIGSELDEPQSQPAEPINDNNIDTRTSAEVAEDSFEEAQPDEFIVVNDDASEPDAAAAAPVSAAVSDAL